MSNSLRQHESQHARPPCPSPTPGVHSNLHPWSQWCHPAISSSVIPFSSCPQSLPASESFPMSQLFAWGGQNTGVSASVSFLPKNTQGWSPFEWTGWISLQSKGLSRVFSNTTVQKHQFFGAHGTRDWFQIGKGVHQGCILSPYLFNFYAEYTTWNARLDESQGEPPYDLVAPVTEWSWKLLVQTVRDRGDWRQERGNLFWERNSDRHKRAQQECSISPGSPPSFLLLILTFFAHTLHPHMRVFLRFCPAPPSHSTYSPGAVSFIP